MISDLDRFQKELREKLDEYKKNPAIALYAYELKIGYNRPGDEDLIAIFDSLELAKEYVDSCRLEKPQVMDGCLRHFRPDTRMYRYSDLGGLKYLPANPFWDYIGVPRNLYAVAAS